MSVKKSIPHFHGWSRIEEGYYTKTKLRNELGLKPFDESDYDATVRAHNGHKWNDYVLYHIDNCIVIKKRKVFEYPITALNIAESLYLINKSAKVSRDTKQENYYSGNYSTVKAAKTRQEKLYELKDKAIKKLLEENGIEVLGYHTMNGSAFVLLELESFTFHMPVYNDRDIEEIENLGEINQQISAEKSVSVAVNFFEAENLLNRYLKE